MRIYMILMYSYRMDTQPLWGINAAINGHLDTARMLVEAGADISIVSKVRVLV